MADGAACWSDAMCACGHCSGNLSGLQKGTCKRPGPNGAGCGSGSDCQSNTCGYPQAGAGSKVCCGSGGGLYAGNNYCYRMADGSACWSDAMCAGGHCSGNLSGLQKGTCRTPLPNGAGCGSGSDCRSNSCGYPQAGAGSKVCCGSGGGLYAGNYYCYSMGNGSSCWSDAMCSSGYCSGNMNGLRKGNCGNRPAKKKCTIM